MIKPHSFQERIPSGISHLESTSEVLKTIPHSDLEEAECPVINQATGGQVINHRRQNSSPPSHPGVVAEKDRSMVCRD